MIGVNLARISQYSKDKNGRRGRGLCFIPELKEWKEACEIYCYDTQIAKHFDISKETFYVFIDKQRYEEEQGRKSEFLDAYKNGRNKTAKFAISNLLQLAKKGDAAASIFTAKTYGGLLETKDIKHIELKKIEVAFKTKQFLTDLASKFELKYEELNEFAEKYFKDAKLDDI